MIAWAIPKRGFDQQPTGKASKRVERPNYLDWIRSLPCIVTGKSEVDAAHISFPSPSDGKLGRGLSRKESDRWTLPLCRDEHRRQSNMNEREYWHAVNIDPVRVCLALYGAYPDHELALLIIRNARAG